MDRRPADLPVAPIAPTPLRVLGEVVWFSPDRGFGFVRPDDGGEDVFLTWSVLPGEGFRTAAAGARIAFVRDNDAHGPVATDVEVLAG